MSTQIIIINSIKKIKFVWFAIPLIILQTLAAGIGFFSKNFYILETDSLASAIRGTDIFSLFIVVPLLAACFILIQRGSIKAFLVWLGTLGIIVYNYTFACFNVHFNVLFLVYTTILGLAAYALVGGAFTSNIHDLKVHFSNHPVHKSVGIFQIIIALLFYFIWLKAIIPAHLNNEPTKMIADWNVVTNAIYVIDMAFLLPAFIWGGISLIKQKPAGYLLSGMNLVIITLMSFCLCVSFFFMYLDGLAIKVDLLIIYLLLFIISSLLTWRFFKKNK